LIEREKFAVQQASNQFAGILNMLIKFHTLLPNARRTPSSYQHGSYENGLTETKSAAPRRLDMPKRPHADPADFARTPRITIEEFLRHSKAWVDIEDCQGRTVKGHKIG